MYWMLLPVEANDRRELGQVKKESMPWLRNLLQASAKIGARACAPLHRHARTNRG